MEKVLDSPRSLGLVCALVINLEVLQNFTAKKTPKPTATTQPMKTTADALFLMKNKILEKLNFFLYSIFLHTLQ